MTGSDPPPGREHTAGPDPLHSERDQRADGLERRPGLAANGFALAAAARSGGRSVRLLTVVRAGGLARHRYSQRRKAGWEDSGNAGAQERAWPATKPAVYLMAAVGSGLAG